MATMTTVTLVDDLDGSEASESVSFALDGASYEIDLSDDNAEKLRDALAGYVASARRVDGGRRGAGRPKAAQAGEGRPAAPAPLRTASRPRPSASGPGPTATRSPSAAGCRPPCSPPSRPRTDLTRHPCRRRPAPVAASRRAPSVRHGAAAAGAARVSSACRAQSRDRRGCVAAPVAAVRPRRSQRCGGTRAAGAALDSSDGTVRSVVIGP